MGTYHLIDGNRVRVLYRGNGKTCARCHKQARLCPGSGLAKNCETAGGAHLPLVEHMKKLWNEIDFKPVNFELEDDDIADDIDHQAELDLPLHTPSPLANPTAHLESPNENDMAKFNGISIRNLPPQVLDEDIIDFLVHMGLSEDHDSNQVHINRGGKNCWVLLEGLPSSTVQSLYTSIHYHESKAKFYEVPLYCKRIRNSSPLKTSAIPDTANSHSSPQCTQMSISPRPQIPGLPESERIRKKKKR